MRAIPVPSPGDDRTPLLHRTPGPILPRGTGTHSLFYFPTGPRYCSLLRTDAGSEGVSPYPPDDAAAPALPPVGPITGGNFLVFRPPTSASGVSERRGRPSLCLNFASARDGPGRSDPVSGKTGNLVLLLPGHGLVNEANHGAFAPRVSSSGPGNRRYGWCIMFLAMMIDAYGRKINYLRLSVTGRCNPRCRFRFKPGSRRFGRDEPWESALGMSRVGG